MTFASHIGQYRILRKIGAGGMGLVFLGEHMLLGRRAAIKTLLPAVAANHENVERFFNEARATSAISDPGVIQIFDFGYHVDGTAYIVMELLEGEALSARIDRLGQLSLGDALRIARQLAGSLAAAHAQGIVHRDLKPDNIFLVSDAEAQGGERTKILDFGICKVGTGDLTLTESGSMIGTPVYMSPEQCCGARDVDHRADIYAFGCLVFHMLTGRPPFDGDTVGELIVAHLEQEPPAPSTYLAELPHDVDAVLLRCLAKARDDRYQSMTELQQVLGELGAARDGTFAAVAAAPPAVPLGKGFRSVYDGNLAALAAGVSRASPAPSTRWFLPSLPSAATPPPTPAPEALDVVRPRHLRGRVMLACALLASVVIGLGAMVRIAASEDAGHGAAVRGSSEIGQQAALPVEQAPALSVSPVSGPAASTASTTIVGPGATHAATATVDCVRRPAPASAASIAASVAASVDQSRSPRDVPREVKQPAARPQRPTAPMARPPTPPHEDLYDTR